MRFDKYFTSFFLAIGLGLVLAWPWIVREGRPTASSPTAVKRAYSVRLTSYAGAVIVCLLGAGIGAIWVVREARREYAEQSRLNLKDLVEGLREAERRDGPPQ